MPLTEHELILWKRELEISKQQNVIELKKLEVQISQLKGRLVFVEDLSDQLESSLLANLKEELKGLEAKKLELQKENRDSSSIIFSIDTELGYVMIAD